MTQKPQVFAALLVSFVIPTMLAAQNATNQQKFPRFPALTDDDPEMFS